MITENEFLDEMKKFAHMKCLNITPAAIRDVFPKFEEFSRRQLSTAIEDLENSDDKFDFSKLLRRIRNKRADEIEDESRKNREEYEHIAGRFLIAPLFSGECKYVRCRPCDHARNCKIRGREWLRGIRSILNGKLGSKGASQLIDFMTEDFMGGIN